MNCMQTTNLNNKQKQQSLMKKILTALPFVFLLSTTSAIAQRQMQACALEVDYIDPKQFVAQAEVDSVLVLKHLPAIEADELLFAHYYEAKRNKAPDSVLQELAFTILAFYKQKVIPPKPGDSLNWTAEILGWQVENLLHDLQDSNYVAIWKWNCLKFT